MDQFFILNLTSSLPRQKRVRRETRGEKMSLMESLAHPGMVWLAVALKVCSESDIR